MRYRLFASCLLFSASLAIGRQSKPEPDFGKSSGNTFESTYFKFQYDFPQEWSTVPDDLRLSENRKRHEEQVKQALAKAAPDTPNSKTTTQVFWIYDLLIATPKPLAPGEKAALPHIRIWAQERFSMLNEPSDDAKMIANLPTAKVLRKPEELMLAGRKFVRADFVYHGDNFSALFETVSGKYLIGFDFRGSSEKEINDLAQTLQTLKFNQ
jgi:hypothetical protein